MVKVIWLLFLFTLFPNAQAAPTDLCDVIDLPNCSGISKQGRRSTALSLPSPFSSANSNPSTVSFDKGLGVEIMYHPHNSLAFGLAGGTGRTGAALISSSLENSFFGNRVPEIEEAYFERREDNHRYKSQKLTLAGGAKLISKKNFGLDAGLIAKRHSEIKRVNPGAGLAARLGPFNMGVSYYYDDVFLRLKDYFNPLTGVPYAITYNSDTYQEKFAVQTYSLGLKVKNLTLDMGSIKTRYDFYNDESTILIYSAAYRFKNVMLNLAIRKETSSAPEYKDGRLVYEKEKNETYAGIQYSFNKHLILGLHYNYFLIRETALAVTLFY